MFSLSPLVFLVTSSSLLRCLGRSDSFSKSRPQICRSVFTNFNVLAVKTLLRHMRRLTWRGARTRSVHFSIGFPFRRGAEVKHCADQRLAAIIHELSGSADPLESVDDVHVTGDRVGSIG